MRAVNLLPADRKKRERSAPKLTPLHGAGLGIVVGALALGYWGHNIHGQATTQATKLTELEQQKTTLTSQIAKVKDAAVDKSTYAVDRELVSGLTAARVNWSAVMINLARVAPSDVWLKSMSVTAPTGDQAAATPGALRPAAISLDASAKSRTSAALFVSRLAAIPGFVEPRLSGGINPDGDGKVFLFKVEIPVNDGLFGSKRPTTPAAPASTTSATATPTQP